MKVADNYRKAFTEVTTILEYLNEEDLKKIPQNKIDVLKENRDLDYKYFMNDEVDIFKQEMMPETKAILFNFFRDYLCTEKQKEVIIKYQRKERWRAEQNKINKFKKDM